MKYLTRQQVAKEYPIKLSTLAHMACRKTGPAYAMVGKRAIYARRDIEAWLESKKIAPGSQSNIKKRRGRPRKIAS